MSQQPSELPPRQDKVSQRDFVGLLIIAATVALLLYAVLNCGVLQSANDRSRWCTVWSLVERGTYQIDEIDSVPQWSTIDKVRHRQSADEPYHFYSSKPPLFPTMVAGLYWLERRTLGYDLYAETAVVTRLLLVIVNVLPMLLALLSLRKSLRFLKVANLTRWFVLLMAGFASMLNPFLTTLNNHTPAAVCLVFSLAAIVRIKATAEPRSRDFAIVGFTAALTCCFELPAALFGVLSFLVVLSVDWRKTAVWYVPAALIPLAAFFVTNWICTGGIKPFYAYYGTDKYVYVHEGVPSYWSEPQGMDANRESTAVYLFHCVLGHHGILSLTPGFLLTLAGWLIGFRSGKKRGLRTVLWLGAGISLAVLIFYLTRTENYNYGGNSSALRWMLWLTPFWWYGMVPVVEKLMKSWTGACTAVVLLLLSVYAPVYSLTEPWKPPWLFDRMQQAGWIDYGTKVLPFEPPRYAVLNRIPQVGVTNTFHGDQHARGGRLTVTATEAVEYQQMPGMLLNVTYSSDTGQTEKQVTVVALPSVHAAGKDIAEWLKGYVDPADTEGNSLPAGVSQSAPTWVLERLRGMPSARPYNSASPGYLRYISKTGEKSAVRCDRGASRVAFRHPKFGRCWHRCDVYYCDELACGVAQWVITVTQEKTGALVRTETWTCQELP